MISATRYATQAEINRQTDLAQQISQLQQSISSGQRLTRASDDPNASTRIAQIRQTQADQVVWSGNADTGSTISTAVDTSLGSMQDVLNRANELVLSGRNDTTSATDRASIASELRSLASNLDDDESATDPTGAPLYPTTAPLQLPVSDTLSLPATVSRSDVFNVSVASGTKSLQQILNDAADAIENTSATRATDVATSLDEVTAAVNHVTSVRTDQGIRGQRFDDATTALTDSGSDLAQEKSLLSDTDLTYALSEYQSKSLSLQAAQTVFAQSNKSTLFDLLS